MKRIDSEEGDEMRDAIENIIKECNRNRARIFEVSHLKYAAILKRIEKNFVPSGGPLHWSSIENRFQPSFTLKTQYIAIALAGLPVR